MMVYKPHHRSAMSRVHRVQRKRFVDYFLPLFLFISLAVIIILAVQLYTVVFVKNEPMDVFLYTLQGSAKVTPVGSPNEDIALNEMRLFKGDAVATDAGGRVGLNFFKKMVVRLDQSSETILQDVSHQDSELGFDVLLKSGRLWVFAQSNPQSDYQMNFHTSHLAIDSSGGVFEIEDDSVQKGNETVRVVSGSVTLNVVISDGDQTRNVETIKLTDGQQFTMDPTALAAYEKYQSPEVTGSIDPTFSDDDWYLWNNQIDEQKAL